MPRPKKSAATAESKHVVLRLMFLGVSGEGQALPFVVAGPAAVLEPFGIFESDRESRTQSLTLSGGF
jgi:hypothetical protein